MTCNPLLCMDHLGNFVVWCKPCGWESVTRHRGWALRELIAHRKGPGPGVEPERPALRLL